MSTWQARDLLRSDDADNVHSGNEYKENYRRNTEKGKKNTWINLGRVRNKPETKLNRGMDPSIYWIELPFSSDDSSLQP
ncbi:hypothetical protein BDV41DRAFT_535042 [Aspergillus transmontanensis]|uniref:Uncharacterized protein n=1 Tax=Aspergillus transmontanensis TaxID=1034304 RepID=A0A5N6VZY0_9EURO|nr:hypothetical protein BDV41DRAFT_535042 [Aspergillus transmontanensis]